jgi:amino acid adenylation domain-containing protein
VTVGTPIAGRTQSETEGLIGLFVNTLVLRSDLSGNPTFRELLKRVRTLALEAYEHQDVPFEKLVEELHPERDLSRSPLFQVMYVHQNVPDEGAELTGLTVSSIGTNNDTAKFDLSLYTWADEQVLMFRLEYNTDLFDAATIGRMFGHLETLIEGIVTQPDRRLSELPILTKSERQQLLVEWNATQAEYAKDQCVHELFEAQVKRTPDAIAVVYEGRQLTYRELNGKANQLGHALKKRGVGAEVRVGICMERSLEMMIGVLGILKAGGAYVPLDPVYPQQRVELILEDAGVAVLVSRQEEVRRLRLQQAAVLCLDRDREEIEHQERENLGKAATPENLAYVIYTSGSTGKPKGVKIPHGAVVNLLNSIKDQQEIQEKDRLLAVTTLSFDIAGLELFLPLMVGACVELASQEVRADGRQLGEKLATSGATIMQATPATWRMMLDSGWEGNRRLKILCGGEELSRELAAALLARGGAVWNMYGPTETTIWSTTYRVKAEEGPVAVGRPIANTQIYILNKYLQPAPIGIPGELYIGGSGVARGYHNLDQLTAEKFIGDPFSTEPGARLYKTGDLARYRADGNIEVLGRMDQQVKIRGFRIELGEIETILAQHDGVKQVVVVVREDSPNDKRLVAYVVFRNGQTATDSALKDFLRHKLPDYMVPTAFVFLETLPLTPNGKVDRRALPRPEENPQDRAAAYVAPRTDDEKMIANIWAGVLKLQQVGINDNFFDLGGHSLLATQVISRLGKQFGVVIPLRALFETPTVAGLAATILLTQPGQDAENLADLLSELESLSTEEVRDLLSDETGE